MIPKSTDILRFRKFTLCHDPVDGQYCQFYSAMPMLIHFSQEFFVEYF